MGTALGFFDFDERLSDLGDPLVAYGRVVDFEAFRPALEKALASCERAAWWSAALRSGHDNMMLKVLVIQTANALSDERTHFLLNDRLIHAVPGSGALGAGSRMRARSGCPGTTAEGQRDQSLVRALGYDATRHRLHRHGGPESLIPA